MRTLGQKRAEFALDKVTNISPETKERFKPFSAGAPSMILQNGFGQATAFWISKSKGKDEHMAMFNIVKEWLCQNNFASGQNKTDFIRNISQWLTLFIMNYKSYPKICQMGIMAYGTINLYL
jgi:CRISPR type III-B/RAMP module-associated protein Cmr5